MEYNLPFIRRKIVSVILGLSLLFGVKISIAGDLGIASFYQSYANYFASYSVYYSSLSLYEQLFNSDYELGETYSYYAYLNMSSAKDYAYVAYNYSFSGYMRDPTSEKYSAYLNSYYDYYYKLYAAYYALYAWNDYWNESSNWGQQHVYNAIVYSFYGNYYNGFANNNCGILSMGGIY